MEVQDIINKQPLGSIKRLLLIYTYSNKQCSNAAMRCIKKRLSKMNKSKLW